MRVSIWLSALFITLAVAHAEPAAPVAVQQSPTRPDNVVVTPEDEHYEETRALMIAFIRAVGARDVEAVIAMLPPDAQYMGELFRTDAKNPATYFHTLLFSVERGPLFGRPFDVMPPLVVLRTVSPKTGAPENPDQLIGCTCREADCAGRWPRDLGKAFVGPEEGNPYTCFLLVRTAGRWHVFL